ncbi:MAG: TraR/DksA C4-type zinc finger protein [Actinomycetota bacterium]|nr:TraR/DksA C4-type zinc finger protein [Actinomycetota bacterium]MDA8281214.1 TraR/DksA C4-type zinc finger protein [Actinomycetota bacterium]
MAPDAPTVDFRALLEEERAELHAKLAELGFADGDRTGLVYDPNFADTSQVTAERGEAEALALTLSEALADVEHAIAKLADNTYGVCEGCGKPISEARLEAMPAARFCFDCASRQ